MNRRCEKCDYRHDPDAGCETLQPDGIARARYKNGMDVRLQANGCDGCTPLVINGLLCHEQDCPDAWKDKKFKCRGCGESFFQEIKWQALCEGCCDE